MPKPIFEPREGETFSIVHPAIYYASSGLLKQLAAGGPAASDAVARLTAALENYPYHFEGALALATLHTVAGDLEKACNVRYRACQHILDLLPDDEEEECNLDWEARENQAAMELLHASAIDHVLIGDFELAAALFETLLEFDPEDHFEASKTLVFCYIALEERELFNLTLGDLDEKSAERAVAGLWGTFRFTGKIDPEQFAALHRHLPEVFAEFRGETHEPGETYLAEIESDRPSRMIQARRLWLQTEPFWMEFSDFIPALKQA
ncbi:MAG: tetratricopeptide repeat protein [Rikenellaceae bacterium]|jgi:tetratricopeptide (TPR) repeat protein|nr:tetratricopeptide repeat protein [Rikenellaceae bacterium]